MIKLKSSIKQACSLVLSIVIMLATCTGTYVKADEDITKELKKEIIPLKTVEPQDDLKDLMPLKEILKDKEIVGMGEATHGTSEFFKMKHRVFKFLVEEMGYRAFAIEANFGEGEIINDYISNGVWDEFKALNTFTFWTWKTDEVKEMLNWMREYNLKAKEGDKIRFYGFDMQKMRNEHYLLLEYFKKTSLELEKKFKDNVKISIDSSLGKDELTKNQEAIREIIKNVETSKEDLIKKSSLEEYELMLKNLDIIVQYLDFCNYISYANPNDANAMYKAISVRDEYMAKNIKWIKDREKKLGNNKIMLWAHNGHIANYEKKEFACKWMGMNLKELYGDKYYALGFEFFKGKFKAIVDNSYHECEIKESNDKTLGYIFNKLENPMFFMDSKTVLKNKEIEDYFKNKDVFINSVGAVYNETNKDGFLKQIKINDTFDGLIFINETTASKPPIYNLNKPVESSTSKYNDEKTNKISKIAIIGVSISFLIVASIGIKLVKNKKVSK